MLEISGSAGPEDTRRPGTSLPSHLELVHFRPVEVLETPPSAELNPPPTNRLRTSGRRNSSGPSATLLAIGNIDSLHAQERY